MPGESILLPGKVAWILQECPCLIFGALRVAENPGVIGANPAFILFCLFGFHYLHRCARTSSTSAAIHMHATSHASLDVIEFRCPRVQSLLLTPPPAALNAASQLSVRFPQHPCVSVHAQLPADPASNLPIGNGFLCLQRVCLPYR